MHVVDSCPHPPSVLVDDYHGGCRVCTECGLVVDDMLFSCGFSEKSCLPLPRKSFSPSLKSEIWEACERIHVPDSVGATALGCVSLQRNPSLTSVKTYAAIARALHTACLKHGVARSRVECTRAAGLHSQMPMQRNEDTHVAVIAPSALLPRYSHTAFIASLSPDGRKRLATLLDLMHSVGDFRPNAVLAFAIYTLSAGTVYKRSIKKIAFDFDCSTSCIKRQKRKWSRRAGGSGESAECSNAGKRRK